MINTSAKYKQYVYSEELARQFLLYITVDMVDSNTSSKTLSVTGTQSYYSKSAQVFDGAESSSNHYGTLETRGFKVNSDKYFISSDASKIPSSDQIGLQYEQLSDASGNFTTPLSYKITYETPTKHAGKMIVCDPNWESVPKDLDIVFYDLQGNTIKTLQVRNNTKSTIYATGYIEGVLSVQVIIYSNTIPQTRVRIIEDVSGIILRYDYSNIITFNSDESIDLTSENSIIDEYDTVVYNEENLFSFLTLNDVQRILSNYPIVKVSFESVYNDNTSDTYSLTEGYLTGWVQDEQRRQFHFTFRNRLEKLNKRDFPGIESKTLTSVSSILTSIFQDADIGNAYSIDSRLSTIKVSPILIPQATHKVIVDYLAEFTGSIVCVDNLGRICVKTLDTYIKVTNMVTNGSFENIYFKASTYYEDVYWATGWTGSPSYERQDGSRFIEMYTVNSSQDDYEPIIPEGMRYIKLQPGYTSQAYPAYIRQTVNLVSGHKYYIELYIQGFDKEDLNDFTNFYVSIGGTTFNLLNTNILEPYEFTKVIINYTATATASSTFEIRVTTKVDYVIGIDGVNLIDLTASFGVGKEPSNEWLYNNLPYIEGNIPMNNPDKSYVDYLDDSILLDLPKINLNRAIESVTAKKTILSATSSSYTSEQIEYSYYGYNEVIINPESGTYFDPTADTYIYGEYNTGDDMPMLNLISVSSTEIRFSTVGYGDGFYTYVTKIFTSTTSENTVNYNNDPRLVQGGDVITSDNPFLSTDQDVRNLIYTKIASYGGSYLYDIRYRMNPALELGDNVKIEDSHQQNKIITLNKRNINYNGTMSGTTQGVD